MALTLSPLIRFGTSTWTYEDWQGQVYTRQYAKSTFARKCLGEYCQYQKIDFSALDHERRFLNTVRRTTRQAEIG
jgi:hypothetical protein